MTDTQKRIEVLKLLQLLRQNDESPGETILRALMKLKESTQR